MKTSLIAFASAGIALAAPVTLQPLRTSRVTHVPQGLYASPDPSFAGVPIVLANPPPTASSLAPGPGRYAMTYTPYTTEGLCKTYEAISADIARIATAGFLAVRLYATDCHAVHSVGSAAMNSSLQLVLGLYIIETGLDDASITEQMAQIADFMGTSAAHRDAVDLIVVGNEALFNQYAAPAALADLVSEVRTTVRQLGYQGPVTTAEPYGTFMEHAEVLCPAVDIVAANLLPFFHAEVSARQAGTFVRQQMQQLDGLCEHVESVAHAADPEREAAREEKAELEKRKNRGMVTERGHKAVLALEIGWPSQGKANGKALPGLAEQRTAMAAMSEAIGSRAVFASFMDDEWRDAGDYGVEVHWGSIEVFE